MYSVIPFAVSIPDIDGWSPPVYGRFALGNDPVPII
jgi:hypothetical protein